MALRRAVTQRLFNIVKFSSQTLTNCRISNSSPVRSLTPPDRRKPDIAPDPRDIGMFRRFLHKRAMFSPASPSPEIRAISLGGNLVEKLREMDFSRDRIRLDGIARPAEAPPEVAKLSVEDARKLLRVAQMEMAKSRLREIEKSWISYSEFLGICRDVCTEPEQGSWMAKTLDESGSVIVLGGSVCLRPEQVAKTMEALLPLPGYAPKDPRRKELEELESQKALIDQKADTLVRRELWAGLGYLVVQTAGFMRLTFWELSWDVMEPICFYVTSMYFMAGYAFFLRTSKEPSFEGFYQSRFEAKQSMLMKREGFDVSRYNELKKLLVKQDQPKKIQFGSGYA